METGRLECGRASSVLLPTRGEVVVRGSGNYESDEAKEIAHLKKELRDYKDAVEVLKKAIGILGK